MIYSPFFNIEEKQKNQTMSGLIMVRTLLLVAKKLSIFISTKIIAQCI